MNTKNLLGSAIALFLPTIYFGVSYRFPMLLLIAAILMFCISKVLLDKFPQRLALSSYRYFVIGSVGLYGFFKAISFPDLQLQLQTFFYYSIFTPLFFLIVMRGMASSLMRSFLWGFVIAGAGIQLLYLAGFMDWNQYQIVGNVTVLALLSAYTLQRRYLMILLSILVLNTPSTQSQVLLILFYSYLLYRNSSKLVRAGVFKYIVIGVVFLIVIPGVMYLFSTFGEALLFSNLSNARQFDFAARVYDRTLIFVDHFRLIRPLMPVSQAEINALSSYGMLSSAESRVHGIWLGYLIYMGFTFGAISLGYFMIAIFKLLRSNLMLILICLTPWLISSEVNPIKYALCAIAITAQIAQQQAAETGQGYQRRRNNELRALAGSL